MIEAVFEDPAVKAEATRNAEAHLAADAIVATNTSTLPVAGLAEASRDAANFLGIHFFSPVEKMALVETIRGPATSDRAVAKALDFVRQIRKTPIVVNDARFFYANRCIIPYINEGVRMVAEGVAPALIENAARQLGFDDVPLMCARELEIEGSMPRVVRMMAHVETHLSRAEITHVYLHGAARLRRDLTRVREVPDEDGA